MHRGEMSGGIVSSVRFDYLVVPFISQTKRSLFTDQGVQHAAAELQNILNSHSHAGWEYVRVEEITVVERVGCLVHILTGKTGNSYRLNQIVFRRPVPTGQA